MHDTVQTQPKKKRHIGRNALALVCGMVAGVVLAVAEPMWGLVQLWLEHKQTWIFTRAEWALLNLEFAAAYAIGIGLVATVVWWVWGAMLRRHLVSALCLGFVLTTLVAIASDAISNPQRLWDVDLYLPALMYGLMGAVAGAVTWWLSHPRRKNLFVAED